MDKNSRGAAIAALLILVVFSVGAFYLPAVMLALGEVSTVIAAAVAIAFVGAFFLLFWIRGRARR